MITTDEANSVLDRLGCNKKYQHGEQANNFWSTVFNNLITRIEELEKSAGFDKVDKCVMLCSNCHRVRHFSRDDNE